MLELVGPTNALPEGTLSPESFQAFATAVGARAQWLTNMTTRAASQPAFFEALAAKAVPVDYVEMDNETYFWGEEFGGLERGETYARRVDALSPVVRRLFPRARIGMVTAEGDLFTAEHHEIEPPLAAWNAHITKPVHRKSYDAFILHHYAMGKGRLDGFVDEAARRQAFLALPQATLERAARLIAERYGRGAHVDHRIQRDRLLRPRRRHEPGGPVHFLHQGDPLECPLPGGLLAHGPGEARRHRDPQPPQHHQSRDRLGPRRAGE